MTIELQPIQKEIVKMKTELTRRLAAVMFTDIVGFTELMQKDEELGLMKRARHKEVFE